jgi:hypothetical protein
MHCNRATANADEQEYSSKLYRTDSMSSSEIQFHTNTLTQPQLFKKVANSHCSPSCTAASYPRNAQTTLGMYKHSKPMRLSPNADGLSNTCVAPLGEEDKARSETKPSDGSQCLHPDSGLSASRKVSRRCRRSSGKGDVGRGDR